MHTHAPSPLRLVRAAVFLKTPRADWLCWLHQGDVDIFVAINHQAQSGCIHDQPCRLSTPLLLSLTLLSLLPPSISFSYSILIFLSLSQVCSPRRPPLVYFSLSSETIAHRKLKQAHCAENKL